MEVVADMHDAGYMRNKAIELLIASRMANNEDYHDLLRQAICLIGMARAEAINGS